MVSYILFYFLNVIFSSIIHTNERDVHKAIWDTIYPFCHLALQNTGRPHTVIVIIELWTPKSLPEFTDVV